MPKTYRELTIYVPQYQKFEMIGSVIAEDWIVYLSDVDEPQMEIGQSTEGHGVGRIQIPADFDLPLPLPNEEHVMAEFSADEIAYDDVGLKCSWLGQAAGVILKASGAQGPLATIIPFPSR